MCAVTMFTVQITREHHVGEEDVQECLRRLNCGKEVREGSEKSKSCRKTVQSSLFLASVVQW